MRLNYHPDAEVELIAAARFYEDKVPALGAEFLGFVEDGVRAILKAPGRFRIVEGDVRKVTLKQFPYAIYFRMLPEEVRILAFKHHSRHPDYWHYRIED